MSCLTRKLQQNLARYIKRNSDMVSDKEPQAVRSELVSRGVCPSDVTEDQLKEIMRQASNL